MVDKLSVVLDTNVIVSGTIVPRGTPAAILDSWRQRRFSLVTSPEQLSELAHTLRRPAFARKYGIDDAAISALIDLLRQNARLVTPPEATIAVRDSDDERILMIAVTDRSDYLVTGDTDLLVLANDPRLGDLRIVTVRAFREILEHREE